MMAVVEQCPRESRTPHPDYYRTRKKTRFPLNELFTSRLVPCWAADREAVRSHTTRPNRQSRPILHQQTNNYRSPHGIWTSATSKLRHKRGDAHEHGFVGAFAARRRAPQATWNWAEIFFCTNVNSSHSSRRIECESRKSPVTNSLGARPDDLARGVLKHEISHTKDAASARELTRRASGAATY